MKDKIFQNARIKLTTFYIVIMAIILFAYSSALIFSIESKMKRGFRNRFPVRMEEKDPVRSTLDEIEFLIYSIDGMLLVVIGFSSYFLAGKTLLPIKNVLDAQKKFSADASHDLRTPLAIMTTETEVTLKNHNATEEDLRETLESNLEEVKKMSKLVASLLLISRGDNNAIIQSYSSVDVYGFIASLVDKISRTAEEKGLYINLSEYRKVVTKLDVDNFDRAISNILQNAIKYTKTGFISIDVDSDSRNLKIKISDTGVGIGEKDLPHVFDRFYKAEHSRNDNSGSGLGLPIAKLIIEEHGGFIDVESVVGRGTTVSISIPLNT